MGISHTLYAVWADTVRRNCGSSHISLCVKKYPHQLHKSEVEKMRKMLLSSQWDHWPIVSIAALGLRNENIVASLFSWYKYARLLDITHAPVSRKKPTIGLQATTPNEYLHMDSTYYYMNETCRICICFVMDNYSKMILGYAISETLSFRLVMNALKNALKIIAMHPDQKNPFLVADGGSENHNKEVDAFIRKVSGFTITKIRALKDIRFSNSPVEAIHKIIKGRYLKNARFDSISALQKFLEHSVYDYNELRPHCKHNPQTPSEVYFGNQLNFDVHARIRKAAKARVIKNKNSGCKGCDHLLHQGSCVTPSNTQTCDRS
jgi:hypothetical protein